METVFSTALKKIVNALETASIDYMIVGGFAVSFHNRARTTNDIDLVLQIYPNHITSILKHFPEWESFSEQFADSIDKKQLFNITDFETGIRYDFITYTDSDYHWVAFQRRKQVDFLGVTCFICSKEDLIISKLKWYNITPNFKQMEDLKFLLLDNNLDRQYLLKWILQLGLKTHGILE